MTLVRRFLVVAALMFWQGGFTFYSAVVVPLGQKLFVRIAGRNELRPRIQTDPWNMMEISDSTRADNGNPNWLRMILLAHPSHYDFRPRNAAAEN